MECFYSPVNKNGSLSRFAYTSYYFVKAVLIKQFEKPFNGRFGATGREDTELFERLQKQGAKYVTSIDGVVYEYIPPESNTFLYFLQDPSREVIHIPGV